MNAFANIGYGLLHAVTMYIIGYAIKRFSWKMKSLYAVIIFIVCVGIIGGITILSMKLTGDRNRTIADYNSIFMVVQSIACFLFFLNIKIKKVRFSKFAPYVFGVYLLNDNQYAREFLWHNILHTDSFYTSAFMPLHLIFVTICFVLCGIVVEFFRINSWKIIRERIKRKWQI